MLRKWKPKEKAELPAPHAEYWELETMKAYGYSYAGWRGENVMVRAKLQAHEIEKSLREAYVAERLGAKGGEKKEEDVKTKMRRSWGLPD